MHNHVRARKIKGTGGMGKVAVVGLLERHGDVRTKVIGERDRATLHGEVKAHVEPRTCSRTPIRAISDCPRTTSIRSSDDTELALG